MGWAFRCATAIFLSACGGTGCSVQDAAHKATNLGHADAHGRAAPLLDRMWAEPDDGTFVGLAEEAAQTRSALLWGPRGQLMGRRLLLLTRHHDPSVAVGAAVLLPAYGVTAVEAVPAIVGVTARLGPAKSDEAGGWGGLALAMTAGSYFPVSVPILWGMSVHPDPRVRRAAVAFLGTPGHGSVLNVPFLSLALLDWHPANRQVAARVLGQHQWWALPAVPALAGSRAWDGNEDVRKDAAYSIRRITTPRL